MLREDTSRAMTSMVILLEVKQVWFVRFTKKNQKNKRKACNKDLFR